MVYNINYLWISYDMLEKEMSFSVNTKFSFSLKYTYEAQHKKRLGLSSHLGILRLVLNTTVDSCFRTCFIYKNKLDSFAYTLIHFLVAFPLEVVAAGLVVIFFCLFVWWRRIWKRIMFSRNDIFCSLGTLLKTNKIR